MARRRLLWQLYPSYLLITLISLLAVAWYASWFLRDFFFKELRVDLETRAHLVQQLLPVAALTDNPARIDALCKKHGKSTNTRITIILPSGKVIGDSDDDPAIMENHANRAEVVRALAGEIGHSLRPSPSLHKNMMYVAIPFVDHQRTVAVVRTSIPTTSIDQALRSTYIKITLGGTLIALFAAMMSLVISRRISRPLEEIRHGAMRFARGELDRRLPVPDSEEFGALAETMNQMAVQLDERIRTTLRQRNEQEAVLLSMMEGVLAIDNDENLINLNQAAARLLGIDAERAQGRNIHEVVRNPDLQRFIARVMMAREPIEGEVVLRDSEERYMQAHGTILHDEWGHGIGALVVLNDMTRLRRLENMRRDFVANVSHELKTPITAIKGFVETLQDGAINQPEDAERFLGIIAKQADRLNAIIEDLLSLSRIEQEAEKAEIHLESAQVCEVVQAAQLACAMKAEEKDISIDLSCSVDLTAQMNPPLIEQAVINLIDNAIKYSDPGSTIRIKAFAENGEIAISVQDQGCGISKEHLPRLFERFYRVDKGRSRKMGGTGLGLAIVKHIAQAHNGRITVDSTPGQGSTFALTLPGS
ncbi:MAG: two-component system histidine kinase PnpS [Armatimonadota bacterium]